MKGSNYPSACAGTRHADRYIAFVKKLLDNRKIFVCLVGLMSIILFSLPAITHANPIEDGFKAAAAGVVSVAIAGSLWLLNWVSVALLLLAVAVLKTVMAFVLQAAYTPLGAGEGSSITVAWELVRDFSNMLFILILIAIAVGTMLMNFKLPLPGQQKIGPGLLVKFFIIAALINFTPVLTGIVIDISNILTKFFFDVAAGGANAFITFNPFVSSAGDWKPTFNLNVSAGLTIQYATAFLFNLVASLILFTVAFLLVVRVLALWILVIFSPLAFAASILPQTQHYFKKWWDQFLQWAIMPVPIGLFLFIAALMLATGDQACTFTGVGTEIVSDYDVPVNNVLQGKDGRAFCGAVMSTMALGTVVAGMMAAFSVSAKGSGFIVGGAQSIQKGSVNWANRRRIGAQQATSRAAKRTAREGFSYRAPFSPPRQVPGLKSLPDKLVRGAGLPVIGGALGAAAAGTQRWLNSTTQEELDVEESRYKGFSGAQIQQHFQRERNPRRVAILSKLLSKEDNDAFAETVSKNPELQDIIGALRESSKTNVALGKIFKDVLKKNVHLTGNPSETIIGLSVREREQLPAAALRDPRVIKTLETNNLTNDKFFTAIAKNPKRATAFADGYLKLLTKEKELQTVMGVPVVPDGAELDGILQKRAREGKDSAATAKTLASHPILSAAVRTARKETPDEQEERKNLDARDAGAAAAREANNPPV